ncbi:MAG TPA: 3-phosphoshikimate 1-carboxyvinyltransferase [Candidatus Omnitrophota bacterium]|nr:3-phosphoshikimate 1-carboxyvinyltransferase [Candidatus Omnitrophota bacterium]
MQCHRCVPLRHARGSIEFLGDKSIAHRAVIVSALSDSKTTLTNFPASKDCCATIAALQQLGVPISVRKNSGNRCTVKVCGVGLYGLMPSRKPITIQESGTTFRLLAGVLAGQPFCSTLAAGPLLSKRPMKRITLPLRAMGASIQGVETLKKKSEEFPPLAIRGASLRGITYRLPVASAQVQSAILLAGLFAHGKTSVIGPPTMRDHTARMLRLFGVSVKSADSVVSLRGADKLISPGHIVIPGDISSAAFFIVLASIVPGSHLVLRNVSLNPTRIGIISVLKRMGASITVCQRQASAGGFEPCGSLIVKFASLHGTVVKKTEIPLLIDELPVLMVAASKASGKTIFQGVQELRVKETDRIQSMVRNLNAMGVRLTVRLLKGRQDIIVEGGHRLRGASVKSYGDHRTAMSMIVAAAAAEGVTKLDDVSCIKKSFPSFLSVIRTISK